MGQTSIKTDFIKNLQIATMYETNNVNPYLFQLLGQRKMIAKELLSSGGSDDDYQNKIEIYNYINTEIRQLLGL